MQLQIFGERYAGKVSALAIANLDDSSALMRYLELCQRHGLLKRAPASGATSVQLQLIPYEQTPAIALQRALIQLIPDAPNEALGDLMDALRAPREMPFCWVRNLAPIGDADQQEAHLIASAADELD
jgi:hypothetical protein